MDDLTDLAHQAGTNLARVVRERDSLRMQLHGLNDVRLRDNDYLIDLIRRAAPLVGHAVDVPSCEMEAQTWLIDVAHLLDAEHQSERGGRDP